MNTRILVVMLLVAGGAGCAASRTQRVPTMTPAPQAAAPAPPPRDIVKEMGDTTWNVVTAPARLIVPKKEPRKEPEVYEAPTAVFMRRNYGEEDGAAGNAATAPATRP